MREILVGLAPHAIAARIFPEPAALGDALARLILAGIEQATRAGRPYLLGCPGGRSAQTTYRALGGLAAAGRSDLSRLVIVMMDEYVFRAARGFIDCPVDAHYSCHRFAYEEIEAVLNRGLAPSHRLLRENVWFPDPSQPGAYDDKIRAAGGVDLFIIASGASDGHVAFNPPGHPAGTATRVIQLAESTRTDNMVTFPDFTEIAEVPSYGVSVGLGTIASLSRAVVLVAHGPDKQNAVRRLAVCDGFNPRWPASIIFGCAGAQIMLDESAASGLAGTAGGGRGAARETKG